MKGLQAQEFEQSHSEQLLSAENGSFVYECVSGEHTTFTGE